MERLVKKPMSSPTQDTLAVLLLCAKLGQGEAQAAAKPLTTRQYSALEKWLQERSLRPRDLLQPNGRAQLSEIQVHEVAQDQIEALLDRGAALGLLVERWTNSGIWIVGREDQPYPSRYKNYLQHKAPPIVYGVGEQSSLQRGGLAVVGSRRASEEETGFAQRIGAACADQKIPVISGAAKGIDSESMMAAINQGGTAIGVLADGLGRAAIAAPYHEAILDGRLTLISPYEPESRWFPFTAMERNKLIYALADAALVVASSDEQGGTWSGAVEALKQRQIPIYVKASGEIPVGNRKLIESGAHEFPQEPWDNLHQFLTTATMELAADKDRGDSDGQIVGCIFEVLSEPMDERSVAKRLNLPLLKTRSGLKRAVQEGRVRKTKNPVRYIRESASLPLFATGGEAAINRRPKHSDSSHEQKAV
jgi:predicted Rossmann fold nucleotide-binding protein DprA/Smf involved in DNA uptake